MRMPSNCKNCGAPLAPIHGRAVCGYCGTVYEESIQRPMIIERRGKAIPLKAFVRVDRCVMQSLPHNAVTERIAKDIARNLANEIVEKYMDFKISDEGPDGVIFTGSIRLLEKDFTFGGYEKWQE